MSAKLLFSKGSETIGQARRASVTMLMASAMLLLTACGDEPEDKGDDAIAIIGSSTVYPFAQQVARDFVAANQGMLPPRIDSTGTADGISAFCAGQGPATPDIVNASRRMTAEEFAQCQTNGVSEIIEVEVGRDGIAFVSSADGGIDINLTPAMVYRALAIAPFGEPQSAQNWSDVDGSLPADPIIVYGPPASSGTRAALLDLVLQPACEANGKMAALKESDPSAFDRDCHALRSDSAYISQGEEDELIVRKVAGNPRAVGIFGFSYLEKNAATLKALPLNGVKPTLETIADGSYPASRPLYIYVKKAHIGVTPGLEQFLAQWVKNWGAGGPLAKTGLVPAPADRMEANAAKVRDKAVLTQEELSAE